MRNSWKLGLFTALCVTTTIVGCGDDDDDAMNTGGSAGNHAGSGGSSAGKGGSNNNGGSSAGNTVGGTAGKGGTTNGGSAGKGGTAGGGGTTPAAGAGGEGGSAEGGMGGAGPVDCSEEPIGGASGGEGGSPGVTTAVVLLDNITVKNGATVVKTWAFANGDDIADVIKGDIGDKWLRPPFDQGPDNVALSAFAHDVFSKCDGKPAGSLLNIVPFEKANQYYKLTIGFAQADWAGYTVTADIKLASGGNQEGACGANAALFVQDGAGNKSGAAVQLNTVDGWKSMTLTVPAATMVDHLSVNISDYTCL